MAESPTLPPARTLQDIFPPVRKSHILNCAYPKWHATYRPLTPKSRIVPLTPEFLAYLRADGIVLPADEQQTSTLSDSEDDEHADADANGDEADPTQRFAELHQTIKATIAELGGRVAPKLNWSAPKDAAFMSADNTLLCRSPGDIYLLFKSSDFVTHDLEHPFDDCIDDGGEGGELDPTGIQYVLVLRKWFQINPAMEFRCFVRSRRLLAVSQREPAHFEFLHALRHELLFCIREFFDENLKHTFPDDSFVFDVYIPMTDAAEKRKTWLVDINPFAPRTDSLLFSWAELLQLPCDDRQPRHAPVELRLVGRGDPEAYSFASPQYSTSKLPREVVLAGLDGDEAIWEFAARWRDIVGRMEQRRQQSSANEE